MLEKIRLSEFRLKIKELNARFKNEQEKIYNNLLKQESDLAINLSDLKSEEHNIPSDSLRNNYREFIQATTADNFRNDFRMLQSKE